MAEVTLTNLIKRYGDFVAVDGIDLQIHDRELLVLVGPSGCGKTTTLRMIAGLEEISGGEIRIGKRVVNHVAPKDRNIAMVFQNYALYPHMNVFKNMAFGLKMRRTPKTDIDQRVRATAALLGIEDLLHRKPAQLSGGQRQRVAVGRAIVREPDVFLFDEPLSNLDAKLRVTTRTELVKLQRKLATTMIHVTHDQVEAMMMGDRIVVMNQGKIQQVGTPTEVYNRPVNRFVAEFIGSPPMNFFQGMLVHRDDGLWFQSEFFAVPLEHAGVDEPKARQLEGNAEQQVVFGVRPEHVVQRSEDEPGTNGAMRAEVEVVQALGSETLLDLKIADQEFTARFPANVSIRAGDRINVCFESSKCHLFDSGSGQALSG